jgi:hypothetical protein
MQLFHEACMLLHAGNTKCLRFGTDSIYKIIVRYGRAGYLTLDLRVICDKNWPSLFSEGMARSGENTPESVTVLLTGYCKQCTLVSAE